MVCSHDHGIVAAVVVVVVEYHQVKLAEIAGRQVECFFQSGVLQELVVVVVAVAVAAAECL